MQISLWKRFFLFLFFAECTELSRYKTVNIRDLPTWMEPDVTAHTRLPVSAVRLCKNRHCDADLL